MCVVSVVSVMTGHHTDSSKTKVVVLVWEDKTLNIWNMFKESLHNVTYGPEAFY